MRGSRTKSNTRTNSAYVFSKQQQQQADSAAECTFTKADALSWQDGFAAGVKWNGTRSAMEPHQKKKRENKAAKKAAQKKCSSATDSE